VLLDTKLGAGEQQGEHWPSDWQALMVLNFGLTEANDKLVRTERGVATDV
jgi:hypothetical protein